MYHSKVKERKISKKQIEDMEEDISSWEIAFYAS